MHGLHAKHTSLKYCEITLQQQIEEALYIRLWVNVAFVTDGRIAMEPNNTRIIIIVHNKPSNRIDTNK